MAKKGGSGVPHGKSKKLTTNVMPKVPKNPKAQPTK